LNKSEVIEEIKRIEEKCSEEGWDGYGAYPVSKESVEYSIKFINSLPDSLEDPSICSDPSGDISIEWYKDARRVFSVSVTKDAALIYAAQIYAAHMCGHINDLEDENSKNLISAIKLLFENKEQNNGSDE
jgi:hypothetical protein